MSKEKSKKKRVNLSIDADIYRKAKHEKCLNLSAFLEKKLREELGEEYKVF